MSNPVGKAYKLLVFGVNHPGGIVETASGRKRLRKPIFFWDKTGSFKTALRDEYINDQLLTASEKTAGETYKTLIAKEGDAVEPEWVGARSVLITKPIDTSRISEPDMLGADYGVLWDQNNNIYYFCFLKLTDKTPGDIRYLCEVDIITQGIKFRPNSENRVIRSHLNRYGNNLLPKSWKQFHTPEPELAADTNVQDKIKAINYNDFTGYKWLLVNVKLDWFTDPSFVEKYYDKDPVDYPEALKELDPINYIAVNGNKDGYPAYSGKQQSQPTKLRQTTTPYYTLIIPIAPKGRRPNLLCSFKKWTQTVGAGTTRYFWELETNTFTGSAIGAKSVVWQEKTAQEYQGRNKNDNWKEGNTIYTLKEKHVQGDQSISWVERTVNQSLRWELPPWLLNNNDKILSINYLDHLPFDITKLFNLSQVNQYDDFKNKDNSRITLNNAPFTSFVSNSTLDSHNVGIYLANHNAKGHPGNNPYGALYIKNIDNFAVLEYDYPAFTEKVFNLRTSDIQLKQNRDINKEPKLLTPDFFQVSLINSAGDSFQYNYLRIFDSNKRIKIKSVNYMDPANTSVDYWIEENEINNLVERRVLNYTNNSSIPTKQDQYAQYIRGNSNRLEMEKKFNRATEKLVKTSNKYNVKRNNLELLTNLITMGGSTAASSANPLALLGSLFSGGSVAKNLLQGQRLSEINKLTELISKRANQVIEGQLSDIDNQLATFNTGNSVVFNLNIFSGGDIHLLFKRPSDIIRLAIFHTIYLTGYNHSTLHNLNERINSRWYFVFIQAFGTFSTVISADGSLLNNEDRQLIDEMFAEGVEVRLYRGKNHFFGLDNYEYENWETELLTHLNKV